MVTIKNVSEYLDDKIEKNENFIVCTFYEIRVKKNLTQQETSQFLDYCKNRLENNGYKVFFTGQKYIYQNSSRIVQDNELLIAIKCKEVQNEIIRWVQLDNNLK